MPSLSQFFDKFFCKHEWKTISDKTTESSFQMYVRTMKEAGVSNTVTFPAYMCDDKRRHIQVFVCSKCGEMKRYVTELD